MSKPIAVVTRPSPSHMPMLASADGHHAVSACLTTSGSFRGVLVTTTVTRAACDQGTAGAPAFRLRLHESPNPDHHSHSPWPGRALAGLTGRPAPAVPEHWVHIGVPLVIFVVTVNLSGGYASRGGIATPVPVGLSSRRTSSVHDGDQFLTEVARTAAKPIAVQSSKSRTRPMWNEESRGSRPDVDMRRP